MSVRAHEMRAPITRGIVTLLLAAACAALLPGAGQGVLPQQLGAADLLTQWGLRFDGQSALNGAGYSVSDAGDVNGDGRPDVVLGAPEASNNARTWSGSAYVVFGGASATRIDLAALGANGFRIDGAAETNRAGRAVSGAGDVNGDGRADVLVGAPFADHNGPNSGHDSGSVYVVFGKASTTTVDLAALGDGGFRIDGAAGDDLAASAVSGIGDVNSDGRADVLVGAPAADATGKPDSGAAFVVFGKSSTLTVDLGTLGDGGFRIDGPSAGDHAGEAVSGAGDVNGDGRVDLIVGAPSADGFSSLTGAAFVVFGKTTPTAVDLAALGAGGFQIDGVAITDNAGAAVSGAGDMNGDGLMDVLVGAPEADNNGRNMSGSAYVVFGKATSANVDLAALGSGGFRIDGGAPVDRAGDAVSGAGDVNSDGRMDVLVGATGVDGNGRNSAGAAYVVFGKTSTAPVDLSQLGSGGFRIDGGASTDLAGWAVSDAADMNGDGRVDVLVAAPDADPAGRSSPTLPPFSSAPGLRPSG
jgi:hypothetical protein